MGVAAQVLMNLGLRLERVRAEILVILGSSLEKGGRQGKLSPARIRWSEDETQCHVNQTDDETRNRACQLADEIETLQRAKEEAVASQDFLKRRSCGTEQHEKGRVGSISLPAWLRRNIEQAAGRTTAFKFPCLDTLNALHDKAGEPDTGVLSVLPIPLCLPSGSSSGSFLNFPSARSRPYCLLTTLVPDISRLDFR